MLLLLYCCCAVGDGRGNVRSGPLVISLLLSSGVDPISCWFVALGAVGLDVVTVNVVVVTVGEIDVGEGKCIELDEVDLLLLLLLILVMVLRLCDAGSLAGVVVDILLLLKLLWVWSRLMEKTLSGTGGAVGQIVSVLVSSTLPLEM